MLEFRHVCLHNLEHFRLLLGEEVTDLCILPDGSAPVLAETGYPGLVVRLLLKLSVFSGRHCPRLTLGDQLGVAGEEAISAGIQQLLELSTQLHHLARGIDVFPFLLPLKLLPASVTKGGLVEPDSFLLFSHLNAVFFLFYYFIIINFIYRI